MTKTLSGALLLSAALFAASAEVRAEGGGPPREGAAAAAAPPGVAAVSTSSSTEIGSTIEELYPAGGLRDPFVSQAGGASAATPVAAAGGGNGAPAAPAGMVPAEEFSIHSLELKGVMEDRTGGFAILVDPKFAASFVLKRGKLYDVRNKPVPGVTGLVIARQKTVKLLGPGREDAQVLTMSERDEEKEQAGAPGNAKDTQ